MADVTSTPCPACGAVTLRVEKRWEARPLGTYSLSGNQAKVSARPWFWLVCSSCGAEARAKN